MVVKPVEIAESGIYEWPWDGPGLIVVKGASGGDGGPGGLKGNVGGRGGKATFVIVEGNYIDAKGGDGGDGGPDGCRGEKGSPGQTRFYSVSLPKGEELNVTIGQGGDGGKARDDNDPMALYPGKDGENGEVLLLPILT